MMTGLESFPRPNLSSPPPSRHEAHNPLPPALAGLPLAIGATSTPIFQSALKLDKPVYSSPPPAASNPENNTCKLIEYRGHKVAAFKVDSRELICLPQAFELFLKHLVGGLHTVYTKLKRLDITPIVCNVEQVRILRGLGAIQPGVNRCKLLSPQEFDVLYDDCTNSSARPGRPPKRSSMAATPETLEKLKKSRLEGDYGYSANKWMDLKKSPLFNNGYHYPPHIAQAFPFMPMSHPAMMNLALANHLGMRQDAQFLPPQHRHMTGQPLQAMRNEDADDIRLKESNNNHHQSAFEPDGPLNLQTAKSMEREQFNADRESVTSSTSEQVNSDDVHMTQKPAIFDEHDTMDADDESERDKNDMYENPPSPMIPTSSNVGSTAAMNFNQNSNTTASNTSSIPTQLLAPEGGPISPIETLLLNIQGLLKVAVDNARHREQQINFEKAELKMEAMKQKELRESAQRQMAEEQKIKTILRRRLKREKKTKHLIQEQIETIEKKKFSNSHAVNEELVKQQQQNLRILNDDCSSGDGTDDSEDKDDLDDSEDEKSIKEAANSVTTSIQGLMETFLNTTPKPSTPSCNGHSQHYVQAQVINPTETA